jgi:uncharacterized protein involved in exopolysaccharide biosynthesis
MTVTFAVVMTIAALVVIFMPRAYRSQAKLFVRLGRENAALDPTASFGQSPVVAVPASRENDINSALEILSSRFLIERVVDSVGPEAVLGRGVPASAPSSGAESPPSEDTLLRRTAIIKATRKLEVEAVKKSNIIAIRYDGPSPEVSHAVVSRLIEFYLDRYTHLHRTQGAHQFLAEQTARLRSQLTHAEEALRDQKQQTGLYAPDGQRQSLVARIAQLEDELLRTEASTAAAEAEVKTLRSRLSEVPSTQVMATTSGFPNQVAELLRGQLFALRLKELELLVRQGKDSPEVRSIRNQMATADAAVGREEKAREQITTGPSRIYEEGQVSIFRQDVLLASLRAKAEELRRQRDQQRMALESLNRHEVEIARLQRDLDIQTVQYRKYAESLEQSELDRGLEAERISAINVVQPATYDSEPVRPLPLLYLAVAFVLAVMLSGGLAILAENLDHSLKTPEEIEATLGLPVLITLPHCASRSTFPNGKS